MFLDFELFFDWSLSYRLWNSGLNSFFFGLIFDLRDLKEAAWGDAFLQILVVMILDSIGGASLHLSRDFTPASALLVDQLEDKIVFLHCPGFDHNAWVELVVPPLTALFGDASREL